MENKEPSECPKKTFKIIECTPIYQPQEKPKPKFEVHPYLNSCDTCETHELYITPKARKTIFDHIGWGNWTFNNKVEQGGILLGHVYRDSRDNITYGIVERAIAGQSARGTSAHLEMDHETWKKMIDEVDTVYAEQNLQIIGWYHTHPDWLDVFMSATDKATQCQLFSNDWQFALVLNPHKCTYRAFHGKDSEECPCFMLGSPDELSDMGMKQHENDISNESEHIEIKPSIQDTLKSAITIDEDAIIITIKKATAVLLVMIIGLTYIAFDRGMPIVLKLFHKLPSQIAQTTSEGIINMGLFTRKDYEATPGEEGNHSEQNHPTSPGKQE